jgi:cellulose synthase/poly-beta-1,6-N-acetylglucosamine synthase-like glycosyltransferase
MKPWNVKIDPNYQPSLSIIIPTYNEGRVIRHKLLNVAGLDYSKKLIQLIIVDSASTDDTIKEIGIFKAEKNDLEVVLIQENERRGKSSALNLALRQSKGEVVIVSDTDCFWPTDILKNALPYLADGSIGAIAGQEKLLNPKQSWVTATENVYRDKMFKIQLGESKLHSTVQFEGGFGAYGRKVLDQFDVETGSDDSGTALNMIQKGVRTIVLPQAVFYTFFPPTWKGKMTIKVRRTRQFVRIWSKSFKLWVKGQLMLPKRIFLPEAFLMLINPTIFLMFVFASVLVVLQFPLLALLPLILLMIPETRVYLIELFQNNFVALLALVEIAGGKRSVIWTKAEDSRKNFDADILRSRGLIK